MTKLETIVSNFLKKNLDPSRPILLALSGGPDSMALYHCLLGYRHLHTLNLHVAHVDHQWRSESEDEAKLLRELVEKNGLHFHLKKLNPNDYKGNLEAECRQARLDFFSKISQENNIQAVLMGHHADDQIETTLKRILEGSSLTNLRGLQENSIFDRLVIWRPFLTLSKDEITTWIEKHKINFFQDATNKDPKYLRSRFRMKIIPQITEEFGKDIKPALKRIGNEAAELRAFLDERIEPYMETILSGPFGDCIDLSESQLHLCELKHLIRRFCLKVGDRLSRDIVDLSANFLSLGSANKQFKVGKYFLHVDRKRLFLFKKPDMLPIEKISINCSKGQFGQWDFQMTEIQGNKLEKNTCWKNAWLGKIESFIPIAQYCIGSPLPNVTYQNRKHTIGDWWTDHKIPAFFRSQVPVLWKEGVIQAEFLTGKNQKRDKSGPGFKVDLTFIR